MPITDPQKRLEFARKAAADESLPQEIRDKYQRAINLADSASLLRMARDKQKNS